MIENLAIGFQIAFTLQNIWACFVGAALGTAIGVLPGVGPVATIALLLPITFGMDSITAIIMLAGIYYGAQYGGSTTSILLKLPGEVTSVMTAIDGYEMARKGRGGQALAVSAIGSFIAGCAATLAIAFLSPAMAEVGLMFGPADYFSLVLLGLILISVLSGGSVINSLTMMVLGVALGFVGTDIQTGLLRFTFGLPGLYDGIGFVSMAMGLFGLAEIAKNVENPELRQGLVGKISSMWLTREDWRYALPAIARGTVMGAVSGLLPGGGAVMGTMGAYALEQRISKRGKHFATGMIEAVAAPESANNAAAQTQFVPLLTLGIPTNAVMALVIGALIMQGIQPGPGMITAQPELFWGLIVSMWMGNAILLILNLPLIGIWVRLLSIRYNLLYPAIVIFCSIGAYTIGNSTFDILVMVVFGFVGYLLSKLNCNPAPLLVGFVLGPMLEENLARALLISNSDWSVFVTRPISGTLLAISAIALATMCLPALRRSKDRLIVEE